MEAALQRPGCDGLRGDRKAIGDGHQVGLKETHGEIARTIERDNFSGWFARGSWLKMRFGTQRGGDSRHGRTLEVKFWAQFLIARYRSLRD